MLIYLLASIPLGLFLYQPVSEYFSGATSSSAGSDDDAASSSSAWTSRFLLNESFIAVPGAHDARGCPAHSYTTQVLSVAPLVVYIEGFLSREESGHLVEISTPLYEPSTINHGADMTHDPRTRLSDVALLPRDRTVRCIEARARAFQGWSPGLHVERLRTQRYDVGGHYRHHFDWSGRGRGRRGVQDRVSTFMVYVDAEGVGGGGTEFPRLRHPVKRAERGRRPGAGGGGAAVEGGAESGAESGAEDRAEDFTTSDWCRFIECASDSDADADASEDKVQAGSTRSPSTGVTFKPITGNAIFWLNLAPGGRGYQETLHAGLPVTRGVKVGLNIWSWGDVDELVG